MTNTVHVVTTAEHQYYGRRRNVGDEYDCEAPVAREFQKVGWIRPAEQASDQTYETRDMAARRPRPRKAST